MCSYPPERRGGSLHYPCGYKSLRNTYHQKRLVLILERCNFLTNIGLTCKHFYKIDLLFMKMFRGSPRATFQTKDLIFFYSFPFFSIVFIFLCVCFFFRFLGIPNPWFIPDADLLWYFWAAPVLHTAPSGHSHWMRFERATVLESQDLRGPAVIKEFKQDSMI